MAEMVHGTAIAIDGNGVLLLGPSGSGKSDLALRLIDRGAKLISDDISRIENSNGLPILVCALNIAGKIEVRGIGIYPMDFVQRAPLALIVQLTQDIVRMPPEDERAAIANFSVPLFKVDPFQVSSALKVELALRSVIKAGLLPVAMSNAELSEGVIM
jgi:HPr kinase/phosphorylase